MCIDMCIDKSIDMCTDMSIGVGAADVIHGSHKATQGLTPYTHVSTHVYTHAYTRILYTCPYAYSNTGSHAAY